jgi:hypothetical protein
MSRFIRIVVFCLSPLFLLGSRGCVTKETVVLPEGPTATQLSAEKDKQIAGLVAQVKAEQEARELERAQAALAAANLDGVLFAAEHVPTGLPRNAIEEEAKLGKARLPAPDPVEVIKAKDRVIAILQNEVEKAKALYGQAFNEAAQAKATIAAKDEEIARRDRELAARQDEIVKLTQAAEAERAKHANDVKKTLAAKDEAIKKVHEEYASKERRFFINGARIAGLGLIVAGAIALAVFKLPSVGGGLVGSGVLVGLISIGIETLTNAPWWPYLCAAVFVIVVGLICYGVYRLWVKHSLNDKKTQAIQDMIDEATLKGDNKTVDELKAHLKYRLGDTTTFWGKQQKEEVAALGLINPAEEPSSKATS